MTSSLKFSLRKVSNLNGNGTFPPFRFNPNRCFDVLDVVNLWAVQILDSPPVLQNSSSMHILGMPIVWDVIRAS